jgi:hypothetical protein
VLLLQAANDYDIGPTRVLNAQLERLGEPHQTRIYPAIGFGAIGAEGHSLLSPRNASIGRRKAALIPASAASHPPPSRSLPTPPRAVETQPPPAASLEAS